MLIKPDISRYSVPAQLAILAMIMVVCLFLFSFAGIVSGFFIFNISLKDLYAGEALVATAANAPLLKYYQLANQIGLFIAPALLFAFYSRSGRKDLLRIRAGAPVFSFLLAGIIIFTGLPLIGQLLEWNELLKLPPALKSIEHWMRNSENNASLITDLFLQTGSWQGLAANLLIMAIVPALGEEFIFRGILQPLLREWTKSKYAAVIISAFVFSAVHLQFYGFLPRFALGLYLGYLFFKCGSIWVPVFVHFMNNAISVIVAFFFFRGLIGTDYEAFGSTDKPVVLVMSIIITAMLIYLFSVLPMKKKQEDR